MAKDLSLIFERKPEQWGLRGDPYLWDEMRDLFGGASFLDVYRYAGYESADRNERS